MAGSLKFDDNGDTDSQHDAKEQLLRTSEVLLYACLSAFAGGVLLIVSFASPYWLVSWEGTQSPFKNMGLWEFCFYKFHHPDYQFDHLFNGCHALYGDEYRLIREKLLPGWLMSVQLFATLALIFSFVGQAIQVGLLLRYPFDVIIRFEYHFCGLTAVCHAIAAACLFLAVLIFACCCWFRDWLLYPNFNYLSWSYVFGVIACLVHILVSGLMYKEYKDRKSKKPQTQALVMQMQPQPFHTGSHYMGSGIL